MLASYHHGRNDKHGVVQISMKAGYLIIGGSLSTSITPKTNQCQWKIDGAKSLPLSTLRVPVAASPKLAGIDSTQEGTSVAAMIFFTCWSVSTSNSFMGGGASECRGLESCCF